MDKQIEKETSVWENKKRDFSEKQRISNEKLKIDYERGEKEAVIKFSDLVLQKSTYPINFSKKISIDYNTTNQILLLEYLLPTIEDFPTLQEVKILKNKIEEKHLSDSQIQDIFDSTIYKITLRSISELFTADQNENIKIIVFNGRVNALNKAIGKRQNTCILSIQVKRAEFTEIDLQYIDPKLCFKGLKGVGSSKLSGMVAIQPIMQMNREDKRFTSHYDVAGELDNSTNLAAMGWEDFEHLIREIFEKEFSINDGEVKVTRSIRDGGVDAIAFDPDPIRGGKIIIQAKRYTNTVGVAAVRDLYGTVMSEGATKGILVTTSDYGSDSYEFAKDKPLTLMNGSNLLHSRNQPSNAILDNS